MFFQFLYAAVFRTHPARHDIGKFHALKAPVPIIERIELSCKVLVVFQRDHVAVIGQLSKILIYRIGARSIVGVSRSWGITVPSGSLILFVALLRDHLAGSNQPSLLQVQAGFAPENRHLVFLLQAVPLLLQARPLCKHHCPPVADIFSIRHLLAPGKVVAVLIPGIAGIDDLLVVVRRIDVLVEQHAIISQVIIVLACIILAAARYLRPAAV